MENGAEVEEDTEGGPEDCDGGIDGLLVGEVLSAIVEVGSEVFAFDDEGEADKDEVGTGVGLYVVVDTCQGATDFGNGATILGNIVSGTTGLGLAWRAGPSAVGFGVTSDAFGDEGMNVSSEVSTGCVGIAMIREGGVETGVAGVRR